LGKCVCIRLISLPWEHAELFLGTQAKVFLQAFHQSRLSRSAKLVEDEQWNPAEVTPDLQSMVDILVDSAVRDSPELMIGSSSSASPPSSPPTTNGHPPIPSTSISSSSSLSSSSSKLLRIESITYYTVSCTSTSIILLCDYLKIIVNLSLLTTDTMSRVIEYLKAFNSRTCQVVLGAGAMRSAGLKNITARHLGEFLSIYC
jgi:vacuolar protein sorting-associated protein 54